MNPSLSASSPFVWVLTDGKAGDEAPLIGIVEAMDAAFEVRHVRPGPLFAALMPWGPIPPRDWPGRRASPIAPPFPDICLATGRRAVAYLRALKAAEPNIFTVYVRDPRTRRHGADLLVAQLHDGLAARGAFETITGPHRFSAERLAAARTAPSAALLAILPSPRVAVLVGGDSRHYRFTAADSDRLMEGLRTLVADGASLMMTFSRRTPPGLADRLRELGASPGVRLWDGRGDNPITAMLALADGVVVTADSVNMIGEAAATGRSIQLFHPSGGHPKIARFIAALAQVATVRPFPSTFDWPGYAPIDATPAIAMHILACWRTRRALTQSAPPARP